jgi:hypothetical protein
VVLSVVLGVLLAGAALGGALTARCLFTVPGPLSAARDVVVPRGGAVWVAKMLREVNVIASPLAFRLTVLATVRDGSLHVVELAYIPRIRENLLAPLDCPNRA